MTDRDLAEVWSAVTAELTEASVLTRQQQAWMRLTQPVVAVNGTFIIAAPNKFARAAFESKLRDPISESLSRRLSQPTQIAVTMQDNSGEAPADLPVPAPAATPPPRDDGDATLVFEMPKIDATPQPGPGEDGAENGPPSLFDTDAFRVAERGRSEPDRPADESERPGIPHQQQRPEDDDSEDEDRSAEPGGSPPVPPPPSSDPDPDRRGGVSKPAKQPATSSNGVDGIGRLNPRYNFDTFVIGSSNRFAHAAAFAVAEAPAKAYNPLFIYGGSGLGKTHLLHAVGHYAYDLGTALSVRYVTTEEFTNDFINSLSDRRQQAFQRRYRDVDILLIDDIQFLMDRERTQEEFFHTFNALHNANKQLVISSDRSPKQLQTLEDRLRTRFEWGLLADIQPPDLETRIAILRKKAVQDGLNIPTDAVEFIASQIHQSIRELEGALIRVAAYASLNRKPVDLGLAEEVLHDFIPEGGQTPEVTVDQIMQSTADYFGVQVSDLKGNSRSRVLVNARQVAMYLCRELTDLSLPRIGQAFGGRDHTTVMHANKKIRKQMAERRALYNQIAELTNRLKHTDE
ncbi:chromosomal replication initiator protein DnaA [Glycomyces xiaoerkulensis]|uniref:chromosomal replication initiator protein DnaA n=1 Tax=Glycomyces xiaoerkulensis TaxID=2038139 RepID=UPI0022B7DE06|nr:chromosomal replication initiator protein DnaA [Glycomyces xiaoerkulensis]